MSNQCESNCKKCITTMSPNGNKQYTCDDSSNITLIIIISIAVGISTLLIVILVIACRCRNTFLSKKLKAYIENKNWIEINSTIINKDISKEKDELCNKTNNHVGQIEYVEHIGKPKSDNENEFIYAYKIKKESNMKLYKINMNDSKSSNQHEDKEEEFRKYNQINDEVNPFSVQGFNKDKLSNKTYTDSKTKSQSQNQSRSLNKNQKKYEIDISADQTIINTIKKKKSSKDKQKRIKLNKTNKLSSIKSVMKKKLTNKNLNGNMNIGDKIHKPNISSINNNSSHISIENSKEKSEKDEKNEINNSKRVKFSNVNINSNTDFPINYIYDSKKYVFTIGPKTKTLNDSDLKFNIEDL